MRDKESTINTIKSDFSEANGLYTGKQVCDITGLSRSMLIKLENIGLLAPREIHPQTGYRFYDLFNVIELLQYRFLRNIGMTQKNIMALISNDEKSIPLILDEMRFKISILQRGVEELSLRISSDKNYQISEVLFPDILCYCEERVISSPVETSRLALQMYDRILSLGYTLDHQERLFSIRKWSKNLEIGASYTTKMCIPLDISNCSGKMDDCIELIPGNRALSILYFGSHKDGQALNEALNTLMAEFESRGYKAVDENIRIVGIVCPYNGMQIKPEDYIFRLAIPIAD